MKEIAPGISADPGVRFGKPVVTGTRVSVATILGALAAGSPIEQIMDDYVLTQEQVRSALSYAARLLDDEVVSAAG